MITACIAALTLGSCVAARWYLDRPSRREKEHVGGQVRLKALCDLLCNYQGYQKCVVIVVFDAYKVKGGLGSVEKYHNIHVVYTKEAETADAFIEKATYEIGRQHRVKVATSDGPEQLIILGHGALRLSASAFRAEVDEVVAQIAAAMDRNNQAGKSRAVKAALEKARENKEE